ncbi:hypothetical protein GCM10020221_33840 [Streptomyces thioluteus]|uniref:Uncharacterized protein n=1 Tax=Streptomyces thioluteus TaxID=66431 RepID=A0ABN3X271_STRTU
MRSTAPTAPAAAGKVSRPVRTYAPMATPATPSPGPRGSRSTAMTAATHHSPVAVTCVPAPSATPPVAISTTSRPTEDQKRCWSVVMKQRQTATEQTTRPAASAA